MVYEKLSIEMLVAGRLMGYTQRDWWYVVESANTEWVAGIVKKELFHQLYKYLYIKKAVVHNQKEACYVLNDSCDVQDYSRYQHKLNCWEQSNETSVKINAPG